jgi:hypothetical protein
MENARGADTPLARLMRVVGSCKAASSHRSLEFPKWHSPASAGPPELALSSSRVGVVSSSVIVVRAWHSDGDARRIGDNSHTDEVTQS